jgi:hypothetical protein
MPKFHINVAMNVRAYGFVEIEAGTIEEAQAKIDAPLLRNEFQTHGAGDDDFDYSHPTEVHLSDYWVDDGVNDSPAIDICVDLPDPLPGF